jgi:hypothetical protein
MDFVVGVERPVKQIRILQEQPATQTGNKPWDP